MRYFVTILVVSLFLPLAVLANERPTETSFALSYSDVDDVGETAQIGGTLLVPFWERNLIGPAVSLSWNNPEEGEDFTGGGIGAAWEVNLFDGDSGPFIGAQALYITGDAADVFEYAGTAMVGLKFGGSDSFVKAYVSRTRNFGVDEVDDFDSTDVNVGIGLRF